MLCAEKTTGAIALSALFALGASSCGAHDAPPPPANAAPATPPGGTFKHEAAGIQFTTPAGWSRRNDGSRLALTAPDGDMTIIVLTAAEGDLADVADEVDRQLGKFLTSTKVEGDLQTGTRNGITVVSQRGTGEMRGRPVEWSVRLFEAKQQVLVLAFGAPGSYDKYYPDVSGFVDSVRPI
jgi:predicted Zn-dependent protease